MKYYIYISDTKVDMLLSQIPHEAKKRIATELKFDLKLLTVSRKSETDQEDNRITKLDAVVAFIREYGNIGTVDDPDEYIEDVLPMCWGPYGNFIEQTPLVYFGGFTKRTIVGLGGSIKHVIGSVGDTHASSASITPVLVSYLEKQLGLPQDVPENYPLNMFPAEERERRKGVFTPLNAVAHATTYMRGPQQNLEFVAKRLLSGHNEYQTSSLQIEVLLATPLYVSMAE